MAWIHDTICPDCGGPAHVTGDDGVMWCSTADCPAKRPRAFKVPENEAIDWKARATTAEASLQAVTTEGDEARERVEELERSLNTERLMRDVQRDIAVKLGTCAKCGGLHGKKPLRPAKSACPATQDDGIAQP